MDHESIGRCLRVAVAARVAIGAALFARGGLAQSGSSARAVPAARVEQCPSIDAEKFERLFWLELSVLSELRADVSNYLLQVRCDGATVQITLFDPGGRELLTRGLIESSPLDQESERAVALAAAELIMALDWMPRATPSRRAATFQQPQSHPVLKAEALEDSPTPSVVNWTLRGGVSLAMRSLATTPLPLVGPTLAGEFHLNGPLSVGFIAAFEEGSTTRDAGSITATSWSGGAFVGLKVPLTQHWLGWAEFGLRGVWTRMAGSTDSPEYQTNSTEGVGPDLFGRIGPRLVLDRWLLSPYLTGGFTPISWEARVTREPALQFGGPWLGAGVEIGLSFGSRK